MYYLNVQKGITSGNDGISPEVIPQLNIKHDLSNKVNINASGSLLSPFITILPLERIR